MRLLTNPLLATTALLIGGALTYAEDLTVPGIALLTAGMVTLGTWLAQISAHPDDPKGT